MEDANDNIPVFDNTIVEYQISENSPIGFEITPTITATDADEGTNAELTYSLSGDGVPDDFTH